MDLWVPEVRALLDLALSVLFGALPLNAHLLSIPQPFPDFNNVPFDHTEKMIQFHIFAANIQLRQAYYGFLAASGLDRVLVMPKVGLVSNRSVTLIVPNAPPRLCALAVPVLLRKVPVN